MSPVFVLAGDRIGHRMGSVGGVWGAVGLLESRHAGKGGLLSCPPSCLRHRCLVGLPYWSGGHLLWCCMPAVLGMLDSFWLGPT